MSSRASKDFDLVVLGAARESIFRQVLFGEIPEKVARYSPKRTCRKIDSLAAPRTTRSKSLLAREDIPLRNLLVKLESEGGYGQSDDSTQMSPRAAPARVTHPSRTSQGP